MNLLAIDTSTDRLSIAVQHGERIWQHQGRVAHSRRPR
jgi:tRNA threonylcarbamoyladenosine biosynthesis protein TsaB